MRLASLVRDVPDFPIEGILFKDITTLIRDADAFREAVDWMTDQYAERNIDRVGAIEARGYIFGAPLAYNLGVGFVPIRKPGKSPVRRRSGKRTGFARRSDRDTRGWSSPRFLVKKDTNTPFWTIPPVWWWT